MSENDYIEIKYEELLQNPSITINKCLRILNLDFFDLNSLLNQYKIVKGVPTIGEQRNFIERYYKEGTKLVMFDDDIDGIFVKNDNTLVPIESLETNYIIPGFKKCDELNAKCFGIYAAANHFFTSKQGHSLYQSRESITPSPLLSPNQSR